MTPSTDPLRQANQAMEELLRRISERSGETAVLAESFCGLRETLQSVRQWREEQSDAWVSVRNEQRLRFRTNLDALHRILPDIHTRLLVEKHRLERARTHTESAAAWIKSSGNIL